MKTNDLFLNNYIHSLLNDKDLSEQLDLLDQLLIFSRVLIGHDNLRLFLDSPLMSSSDKNVALENVSKPLNINRTVLNFFITLVKNKRLRSIDSLVLLVSQKKDRLNGLKCFSLVSASAFNDEQNALLKKKLNDLGHKSIELKQFIDPTVVLGFKLLSDNLVYDLTLKTMIEDFKHKVSMSN